MSLIGYMTGSLPVSYLNYNNKGKQITYLYNYIVSIRLDKGFESNIIIQKTKSNEELDG